MQYVIGIIVFIIAITLFGYIIKKRKFKELDKLEAWKMELMNKPVPSELSKVKQLNMTGQTEELFEKWRKSWDEIVTYHLPEVEELLFDAEEYTEKYKFKALKGLQAEAEKKLTFVENQIERIIEGLHDLLGSEEKNKQDLNEAKEKYRDLKRTLLTNRLSFGKSEVRLEILLEEILSQFEAFESANENGNVLEAREIILHLKEQLANFEAKLEHIPRLLAFCTQEVPEKTAELLSGHREMVEQGYDLEHLQIEKEVERIKKQAETYTEYIYKAEIDEVLAGEPELRENLEVLYDVLEKEVVARGFVLKQKDQAAERLSLLISEGKRIERETNLVKQSYHIHESELDSFKQVEKKLMALDKQLKSLMEKVNEHSMAYSLLKDELERISEELDDIMREQSMFAEKLHMLRKDEIEAREKLQELRKKNTEVKRLISKSNLPGLPEEFKYFLEDTHRAIADVYQSLEQKPLNIAIVQANLAKAEATMDKLYEQMEEMIENVRLAEFIIQYGNRYKRQDEEIYEQLSNAEKAFRNYEYSLALEEAASAIEKAEPGALKKLEAWMNEKN
ncbi:septation ring formation regulator EzrA [Bacillus litorisediminis]|uniref:septation ring formation regulator EzrA n=1 Tax=Bacillus litorisediminis TaxID=2922713 RepID=UPI001FAD7DE5|nr:septation ring formation regulator EzrA [Bacillus litorisediminis]